MDRQRLLTFQPQYGSNTYSGSRSNVEHRRLKSTSDDQDETAPETQSTNPATR